MNVFIALKGTHFLFLFEKHHSISKQIEANYYSRIVTGTIHLLTIHQSNKNFNIDTLQGYYISDVKDYVNVMTLISTK